MHSRRPQQLQICDPLPTAPAARLRRRSRDPPFTRAQHSRPSRVWHMYMHAPASRQQDVDLACMRRVRRGVRRQHLLLWLPDLRWCMHAYIRVPESAQSRMQATASWSDILISFSSSLETERRGSRDVASTVCIYGPCTCMKHERLHGRA